MTWARAPRIFLSYARADGQTAADALRAQLANLALTGGQPLTVWQDLTSMHSGQWRDQIRAAIKNGNHLLLVLSPEALKSQVCAWEWHVARLEGAEISPVLADPAYDLATLPKWMTAQHIYRLDLAAPGLAEHPEWQRLVGSLRATPTSRRMPTTSRTPGERFVPRPAETDALRDMLLDTRGDAIGITTAFTGSGGMGKTTLALALAHDQRIQSAFYGGQLLVELGQQPNLLLVLRTALHDLTGENSDAETVKQASERLAAALADRRVLLVIDDVWNWLHLQPFMQGGANCARLVTTRDEGVLAKFRGATKPITVDQMSEDQAVALLGAGLGAADIAAHRAFLASLANRLGRCALLLELANGRIWTWAHDRGGLSGAVDEAEIEFRFKGVTAFDTENRAPVDLSNPMTRNEAYADSIAASLSLLSEEHKARFLELGVLPEDTDIPYASIALYWAETAGMDDRSVFNLLDRLKRMSLVKGALVKDVDPATKAEKPHPAIRLHDVIRSYARDPARTKPAALKDLNRRFWKAHVDAGERAFAEGTGLARYAYERLPWHLNEAGEKTVLDALLLEPGWLQGKLNAMDLQALLSDYRSYAPDQSAQWFVGAALQIAAGPLHTDKQQLLPQLIGRLMAVETVIATSFLDRARRYLVRPALLPTRPSLTPPGAETARFGGHTYNISSLCLLPDGRLAAATDTPETNDNVVQLWDTNAGAETSRLEGHTGEVTSLCLLRDGRLASGSSDLTIRLWDTQRGIETACLNGHTKSVNALAVLPDGRLVSGSDDNTIRLWDATSGVETDCLNGHTKSVNALVVLPDGRLASGSSDDTIRLWDTENDVETARLEGHAGSIHALAVLPDGRLASGTWDGTIRLWDTTSGAVTACFAHACFVSALAVLPDGQLASGSTEDEVIRLWDTKSGAETACLEGHTSSVTAFTVLPDGRLASGSSDQTIRVWDLKSSIKTNSINRRSGVICELAVLLDGRLASGSSDDTIRLWDTESGAETARLRGHTRPVNSLAVLPDGRLASASPDQTIRLWDTKSGAETACLKGHTSMVNALAVLPDGRLASGSSDDTIRLWDTRRGVEIGRFEGVARSVDILAVLPSGRLALGSSEDTIRVWDPTSGVDIAHLNGHTERISALAVLRNGLLASGSFDNSIRVWDLATATEIARFDGHSETVFALAVLLDGRLASSSWDKTIRLWDLKSGLETACLEVDAPVRCLATIPDGRLVAGDDLGRLHWLEVLL